MRTTFEDRPLVLDKHIWIWLVQGDPTLTPDTRDRIRIAANTGNLKIAAITLWDVGVLASRRRIELGEQTLPWLEDAVARSGVAIEPISPRVAAECHQLPGPFHRDPADRRIVATSRSIHAALMTRDRPILDYAVRGHVTALAA